MSQPSLRLISGLPYLKERLAELYAAGRSGDADQFAAGFAEDGFMRMVADSRLVPEAGPFRGRAAIAKGLRQWCSRYEYVDGLVVDVIAEFDIAVTRRQLTLRCTATGSVADFDLADFVRFENGQIIELSTFIDTASLAVLSGRI